MAVEKQILDELADLRTRVGKLELQNREFEFRLRKVTDAMLTADSMHRKLRNEELRHDF
jgi:hypothetical protein